MPTALTVVVCTLFDWFLPIENSFLGFLFFFFFLIKSTVHTENSSKGELNQGKSKNVPTSLYSEETTDDACLYVFGVCLLGQLSPKTNLRLSCYNNIIHAVLQS